MVQISEITADATKEGSGPKKPTLEPEKVQGLEATVGKVQYLEPPAKNPTDHALRVAYIMRSYLSARTSASSSCGDGEDAAVDRCGAMMEVVRADGGRRWLVSKVVLEHSHPVEAPSDPTCNRIMPAFGMEFESISMAKEFYAAYSGKIGFKVKTGSGRRAKGTRTLVMQRFFCSHGNLSLHGTSNEDILLKKKRGPYNKKVDEKAREVVEVVQVESPDERNLERGGVSEENDEGERVVSSPAVGEVLGKGAALEKEDGKGKMPLVGTPAQSKLLRELGVRVSKYSNEERRDIILKYMKKRNNRQVVDRSAKVPSRQALAGRRQRGFGGKFLSKEEMQNPNRMEATVEDETEVPAEVIANAGGAPIVGMLFENEDKAYEYYINYAGNKGFSVRKGWLDKAARNITRSRVYVCSREGYRPKNTLNEARARTGCPARMAIKITGSGKYRVVEFVPDHNHQLAAPLDIQMLKSQRLLAKVQPRGIHQNASLIPLGYKNYLRAKRLKDMKRGDARAMMEYLQKMKGENPSFYYAMQIDEEDQMTNVFWADARSMMDYYYFGDVVCFDTSYKANDYGRPFAEFIGVNHHKQSVIFGAAFLYDESTESFKWLFETFKTAMCGKQPKTILTDNCAAITETIAAVWPGTVHQHCVWQIYQNAVKHLAHVFQGSEGFAHDLSSCLYDFEDEEEFLAAWETMLEKYNLKGNDWLAKLFEGREKWASVYGRQAFCADIQSTLRGENLSGLLKEYLNPEIELLQFFKRFESLVEEKRNTEVEADYHANQSTPIIHPRLFPQTANVYTPAVFEIFRKEVELCMDCMVYSCREVGTSFEYEVTSKEKAKAHFVRFDSSDGTAICTCKKFEFMGIQCCHVLKVLHFKNIKELPPQCILQRWTKDAKAVSLRDNHGFAQDADHNSSISKRYNSLCRILYKIAERAAESIDTFMLMVGHSDRLLDQVEHILQAKLLDKPSTNANNGQTANGIENQIEFQGCITDNQQVSGKKKKDGGVRRRHQNGLEMNNKRQKVRKGHSDEAEPASRDNESPIVPNNISPQIRNPSNQFFAPGVLVQGASFTGHQYALGTSQSYQAMTQFGQDSSAAALQQSFHVGSHLSQNAMQGFPTLDMHPLQFMGNNPQLDHQSSDQGAQTVWDFL